MSIAPALDGMPPPSTPDAGGAIVAHIKELGDGVLITMSDGREIKVLPGDDIDIRPITRDTKVTTMGNPEPRTLRDLHNAGQVPDMIAQMFEDRPINGPTPEAPTPPALAHEPGNKLALALAAALAQRGGQGAPMLPDMADALGQGAPPGAEPDADNAPGGGLPPDISGAPPDASAGGMSPAPGTPPPLGLGPLGMPPGSAPSDVGPPARFRVPRLPDMPQGGP